MNPSYGEPLQDDKIHAKSLKTGKKEISTHVFGNFNAPKAETLIAPQQYGCHPGMNNTGIWVLFCSSSYPPFQPLLQRLLQTGLQDGFRACQQPLDGPIATAISAPLRPSK
jgi:hypothetical protein